MKKILRDKYLRVVFGISFLIFLIAGLFAAVKFIGAGGPLIIHYDVFRGIDFVGGKMEIFGILFSVLVMMAANFFLAEFIYERERFMSYLFAYATLALSILFAAIIIVISGANF